MNALMARNQSLRLWLTVVLFASSGLICVARAQSPLTAVDVAAIERLSAGYGRTLGACLAREYADLFEQPNGFFESLNRGRVRGRLKLEALVRSERHCNQAGAVRSERPSPPPVIDVAGGIVTGRVSLGDSGHYDDVYVKTADGWRFRSRNFVPRKAEEAQLTYRDFAEIRALAGDQDQFEDSYVESPSGRLFRSSGLTIDPVAPGKATGRARLANNDGYYNDVYVKTSNGWRFASRIHEAAPDTRSVR
jgi:hypothetical protein